MDLKKSILIISILVIFLLGISIATATNTTKDTTNIVKVQKDITNNEIIKKTHIKKVNYNSKKATKKNTKIYVSTRGNDTKATGIKNNPYKTISLAINKANDGDTILFEKGTYKIDNTNTTNINKNIIIKSVNKNQVIIKSTPSSKSLFQISNKNTVTIKDIIFKSNNRSSLFDNKGVLTISNVNFTSNNVNNQTKSCALLNNYGKLKITSSTFSNNKAIYTTSIFNKKTLEISKSIFKNNKADYAGTVINYNGTATIKNSQFIKNYALTKNDYVGYGMRKYEANLQSGGALSNDATMTIMNCNFTNNRARNGGAINNRGKLSIINSRINSNIASNNAGAIQSTKKLIVKKSSFKSNHAQNGGAIGIFNSNTTISNTIFNKNFGQLHGGAIEFEKSKYKVFNSKFTRNYVASLRHKIASDENENWYYIYGGAISSSYSTGKILKSNFNENYADCGGAIAYQKSKIIIQNSKLYKNYGRRFGGALSVIVTSFEASKINIDNCVINNNDAGKNGKAIYNAGDYDTVAANITITNSKINSNGNTKKATSENYYGADSIIAHNGDTKNTLIKIRNTQMNNNKGQLIYDYGYFVINKCQINKNTYKNGNLIMIINDAKIVYTNLTNNNVKNTVYAGIGQKIGKITITKSKLYNPKAKYEIYNINKASIKSIKCYNNFWGKNVNPKKRVYQCKVKT